MTETELTETTCVVCGRTKAEARRECCQRPATVTDDDATPICAECWAQGCSVVEPRCSHGAITSRPAGAAPAQGDGRQELADRLHPSVPQISRAKLLWLIDEVRSPASAPAETVAVSAVEALVAKWRAEADEHDMLRWNATQMRQLRVCADELATLLPASATEEVSDVSSK